MADTKKIDLNELNKMAGGKCKSVGEMFGNIAKQNKDKKETVGGVTVTSLSKEDSAKILGIFTPE